MSPPAALLPNLVTVFAGLMLGMFLGAVNQTIIAPAMPRIVAELGGMEHYSWIVVSRFSLRRVIVPIVGKLSDLIEARSSVASLSRSDLAVLERIGMAASAALVLDLTEDTS